MARDRQRKANSTTKRTTHVEKLRAISRRGVPVNDPTSKRAVAQQYRQLKDPKNFKYRNLRGVAPDMLHAATKKQAAELRARGFRTTKGRVVVDRPRNRKRETVPGSRVKVLSGGVVSMSVRERRDYIVGFTAKEKKEFAKNPETFIVKKMRELREKLPTLARSRKPQIRLQWGAYQATKDFSATYFTARYFATISPEEIRREGKRKAKPRADKLTGLHIVVHVRSTARKPNAKTSRSSTAHKTKGNKKHGKGKKK